MPSDRRLYLFDIDGTLIATGGAGSTAMRAAFNALWRIEDGFVGVEFSGRTDRAILRDALRASALDNGAFPEDLRRFKRAYFRRLPSILRALKGQVLPGVAELLDRLQADDGAFVALGTGNFRGGAALKLGHYGLDHYFATGGFGDTTEERPTLIAQALAASKRCFGRFDVAFVIGDTPHDVRAAKANGVIAVGVATGTSSQDELAAAGADIVLPDLSDASALLPR
jgi:phosphoglycolate phosphatase-like HAD superfamily hydrolase